MRIRTMTAADLDVVCALFLANGWADLRQHFTFYLRHAWHAPFVADAGAGIVGAGVATQYGDTGWLGQIMVAAAARRQGVGEAMTTTLMDHLREQGCRSLALTATPMGFPLYQKLGFVQDGAYHLLHGAPEIVSESTTRAGTLRQIRASDAEAVYALDRAATGEDRARLLQALLASGDGWVITDGQVVTGYALETPWGNRVVIAPNAADARLLLSVGAPTVTLEGAVTAFVPSQNTRGHDELTTAGFVELRQVRRMVWGEPIIWRPDLIWGTLALALG